MIKKDDMNKPFISSFVYSVCVSSILKKGRMMRMYKKEKELPAPKKQKPLSTVEPIVAKASQVLQKQGREENIYSDVNGSYTGNPVDGGTPEQDADDL